MRLLGIVLIVLGVIALVYQGVTLLVPSTTDLGLSSIAVSEEHSIPLPPIVGGIALLAGILLVQSRSKAGEGQGNGQKAKACQVLVRKVPRADCPDAVLVSAQPHLRDGAHWWRPSAEPRVRCVCGSSL
jgi:hypothetical protein